MKNVAISVSLLALLATLGCGKAGNGSEKNSSGGFHPFQSERGDDSINVWSKNGVVGYEIHHTENGVSCSTGKHEFHDVPTFCEALWFSGFNNNCAKELRLNVYDRSCN